MINLTENITGEKSDASINKWLLLLLLLAAILTLWMMLQEDNADDSIEVINQTTTVQAPVGNSSIRNAKQSQKNVVAATQQPLIPWQKLERAPLTQQPNELFKVHSWLVLAPVKRAKSQPAPAPVAPPVPFTYVGKLDDSPTGTQFFLMENGRLFSVLLGDKIGQQWRLDSEDAGSLYLTFLPLKSPQTLSKTSTTVFLPATEPVESSPSELNL